MNDPVLGDAEIVQMGMSIVVMMAMPYATASGAHIRVDIFDRKIGCWGRFLGDALARSLGAYILFLLIRKTWDKALDAHEYGDVTNMIEIPVWIAYGAITIGMGGYAVVLIVQLVRQFLSGVQDSERAPAPLSRQSVAGLFSCRPDPRWHGASRRRLWRYLGD